MDFLFYACIGLLLLSSGMIIYADFRERLIALWVLLLFGANTVLSVLLFHGSAALLINLLATSVYLGFIWLSLKAYLYVKHKQSMPILDVQLGKADVIVIFFIGITFNPSGMILFFCAGFVGSLLIFIAYRFINPRAQASIPLAALLVFCYLAALIVLNLIPLNLVACSFVKP